MNQAAQASTLVDDVLLSIKDLTRLLQCTPQHIANLRKQKRIPAPVKLGTLVRWPLHVYREWVANNCPTYAASEPRVKINGNSTGDV